MVIEPSLLHHVKGHDPRDPPNTYSLILLWPNAPDTRMSALCCFAMVSSCSASLALCRHRSFATAGFFDRSVMLFGADRVGAVEITSGHENYHHGLSAYHERAGIRGGAGRWASVFFISYERGRTMMPLSVNEQKCETIR
jgi:hypothetical protein